MGNEIVVYDRLLAFETKVGFPFHLRPQGWLRDFVQRMMKLPKSKRCTRLSSFQMEACLSSMLQENLA